jgi:TusA-related sulfurtransferase
MVQYKLDILGKVCPYCLLAVRNSIKKLSSGDSLVVMSDHPPAATDTIPRDMKKKQNKVSLKKLEPGIWEITITKE